MTGQQTLIARAAIGIVAGAASLWLASSERLRSLPKKQFDRVVFGAFAASRLGLFALVFLVLRVAPRGDVPAYYFDQAQKVLQHLLPYRDFVSSYAPLHPYLDAALIAMWHSPLAIMLFSVVAELILLPLWMRAGRLFIPESDLRLGALLYLASPISLQFVAVDGQDNVVIALLLVLALWLLLRSGSGWGTFAAGTSFGVSVAAIKFLPLLYAPAFFVAMSKRWRLAGGALVVCGVVYGGFLALGAPILSPLAAEGDLWSAGDLPYLIEAVFGVRIPYRLSDAMVLLTLVGIFALIARAALRADRATRMRALTYGMAALTLALLVFSKKSWPPYLMLALFPVCLLVACGVTSGSGARQQWKVAAFAVFGVVAVTEHSYWASSLAQFSSMKFHRALLAGESGAVLMLVLEVLLIAGYLWLLWEAVGRIAIGDPQRQWTGKSSGV